MPKKPAPTTPTKDEPEREPQLRDLLLAQLRVVRAALLDAVDPLEFVDFPEWNLLIAGADREDVVYAIAYLRGAHEALNVTLLDLLDEEHIDHEQLETVQ